MKTCKSNQLQIEENKQNKINANFDSPTIYNNNSRHGNAIYT